MDQERETEIMSMLFYQQLLRTKIIQLEKTRILDGFITTNDQELLDKYIIKLIDIDKQLGE